MTTPRTPAQQAASRLNGAHSQGPTTPQGRLASSRNATKHGLSGEGKNLPPNLERELDSEIAIHTAKFHPRDPYEHDLIRRAALGNLRASHIANSLNALSDDRARNATRLWDETRASEISSLADQLPSHPQSTLPLLLRTAEGCDYLADSWESLAQTLRAQNFLDDAQSLLIFHLLGHSEPPALKDDANPLHSLYLSLLSLQFDHNPRPLMRSTFRHVHHTKAPLDHTESSLHHTENPPHTPGQSPLDLVRGLLPDPSDARADLAQFLQTQIANLEAEGNRLWELYDLPSRQSAPRRAAFDASPETARLDRYLAAAERMRRRALEELSRLRRDEYLGLLPPYQHQPEPPAPNEPEPTPPSQAPVQNGQPCSAAEHPDPVKMHNLGSPDGLPTRTPELQENRQQRRALAGTRPSVPSNLLEAPHFPPPMAQPPQTANP